MDTFRICRQHIPYPPTTRFVSIDNTSLSMDKSLSIHGQHATYPWACCLSMNMLSIYRQHITSMDSILPIHGQHSIDPWSTHYPFMDNMLPVCSKRRYFSRDNAVNTLRFHTLTCLATYLVSLCGLCVRL